jgi:excisionase family DNA binding protein
VLPRVNMTNEILNIREVAELLRGAEKTVYSIAQRGEQPAFKVRGQWRVRRADLDAWNNAQRAPARPRK